MGKKGCGGREVRTAVTEDPWMDFQVLSQQMCRCQHKLGQHKLAQLQKQNSPPAEV